MSKKILLKGSVLRQSGYSLHARFAYRALKHYISKNELDHELFIIPTPWGQTGEVPGDSPEQRELNSLIQKTQDYIQKGNRDFDISVQVTIPNEFELIAPINVGVTAGIESDRVAPIWLQKANMMSRVVVPSHHSATGFTDCSYSFQDPNTKTEKNLLLSTPIFVVNYPDEYCDLYSEMVENLNLNLTTDFNFLSVAQMGPRKNVEMIIEGFLKEFAAREDVGLILKLSIRNNSRIDYEHVQNHIRNFMATVKGRIGFKPKCKIYVLHGDLTEKELYSLYSNEKIKGFINLSHGEGYGLPIFEAALVGIPIIAPAWGGCLDFLEPEVEISGKKNKRLYLNVDFEIKKVQDFAVWKDVIIPESKWCFPEFNSYCATMRKLYRNYDFFKKNAMSLSQILREKHSREKIYEDMAETILAPILPAREESQISEENVPSFDGE
jgi:glycosyltransferase involved in cell wall biosynthesis